MEPVTTQTYVTEAIGFVSDTGRVSFVNVTLATGHKLTMRPEVAPRVGDEAHVAVTFPQQPALHLVEHAAVPLTDDEWGAYADALGIPEESR